MACVLSAQSFVTFRTCVCATYGCRSSIGVYCLQDASRNSELKRQRILPRSRRYHIRIRNPSDSDAVRLLNNEEEAASARSHIKPSPFRSRKYPRTAFSIDGYIQEFSILLLHGICTKCALAARAVPPISLRTPTQTVEYIAADV